MTAAMTAAMTHKHNNNQLFISYVIAVIGKSIISFKTLYRCLYTPTGCLNSLFRSYKKKAMTRLHLKHKWR